MSTENFKFFQHKQCEFWKCHKTPVWKFNCLWCFCPLFNTKECVNNNQCEECIFPHVKDNYDTIIKSLKRIYEHKRLEKT